MGIKELLAHDPREDVIDRIEWMAFMDQCHHEAEYSALKDGWIVTRDQGPEAVIDFYLNF